MLPISLSVLIWSSSFSWLIRVPAETNETRNESGSAVIGETETISECWLCYQLRLQTGTAQGPRRGTDGVYEHCLSLKQEPESLSPLLPWSLPVSFRTWEHTDQNKWSKYHCMLILDSTTVGKENGCIATVFPGLWGSCCGAAVPDSWLQGCQQWAGSWHSAPGWWWPALLTHSTGSAPSPPIDERTHWGRWDRQTGNRGL